MAADNYSAWLKKELGAMIGDLDLPVRQERFMRARWLDQIVFFERKARQSQQRYYVLRLVGIVGGLTVPALVSLNVRQGHVAETIAWITFVVSLVVAIAIAIEGFFRYGERWRHYRRTVEQMKGQGWQFYELAGSYAGYRSHRAAFHPFATAVEGLLAEEVDVYVRQIARDQRLPDDKTDDQQGGAEGEPVDEQGAAESEPAEQGGFPEAEPEEPQGGFPKAEPEEPQGGFPKAEPEGEPKD